MCLHKLFQAAALISILNMTLVDAQPAFEVASIRPSAPGTRGTLPRYAPGGRFTAVGSSVKQLIEETYGLRDFQLSGGPGWVNSDRYDIVAKAEAAPDADKAQIRRMLQTLKSDRFQLVFHRETKEITVYVLAVGKSGPKLNEARHEADADQGVRFRGIVRLAGLAASISQLAVALSDLRLNGRAILDRPVLDRTGLTGAYDFTLVWTPEDGQFAEKTATSDPAGPSIFTAVQEQLGLRLESRKAPIEFIVIDRVSKPLEN